MCLLESFGSVYLRTNQVSKHAQVCAMCCAINGATEQKTDMTEQRIDVSEQQTGTTEQQTDTIEPRTDAIEQKIDATEQRVHVRQ